MRKLVVIEFLSLDGVMQAPGAPDEDTEGGFQHGGWQLPYFDDVLGASASEGHGHHRRLPAREEDVRDHGCLLADGTRRRPFAGHLTNTRKYVASTTLREVGWQNSTLVEGDVPDAVATLKEQLGGNIAVPRQR